MPCKLIATKINKFWFYKIYSAVKRSNADLIIVWDLPLAITAILVGRLTSTPVCMDMAENYPAMIEDTWVYKGLTIIDFFIRNPYLLKILEKSSLKIF